jgi:hypothetical protein
MCINSYIVYIEHADFKGELCIYYIHTSAVSPVSKKMGEGLRIPIYSIKVRGS